MFKHKLLKSLFLFQLYSLYKNKSYDMLLNSIPFFKTKKKKQIILFFLLFCLHSSGISSNRSKLSLDFILRAKSSEELQLSLKENQNQKVLKKLCDKQKEEQKIPLACYKLGETANFWCLNLKLEDFSQLKEIEQALKSSFVSEKCKNYLKKRKEILKYREKDFFLPELKNFFTGQKKIF